MSEIIIPEIMKMMLDAEQVAKADDFTLTEAQRVGLNISKTRKVRNMTREELGRQVGLSTDRVQKYENGQRKPKMDMILKFAKALNTSPYALTTTTGSVNEDSYALAQMLEKYNLKIEQYEDAGGQPAYHIVAKQHSPLFEFVKDGYKIQQQRIVMEHLARMHAIEDDDCQFFNELCRWPLVTPDPNAQIGEKRIRTLMALLKEVREKTVGSKTREELYEVAAILKNKWAVTVEDSEDVDHIVYDLKWHCSQENDFHRIRQLIFAFLEKKELLLDSVLPGSAANNEIA